MRMWNVMKKAAIGLLVFDVVTDAQVNETSGSSKAPVVVPSATPVQSPVLMCNEREEDPNTIYLAGITPADTADFAWSVDIFEYTVQLINEGWRDDILKGFGGSGNDGLQLKYKLENSNCSETLAVRRYWVIREENGHVPPHGVIGDRCSEATISLARITGLESVPLLSPASTSAKLSSQDEFPFFSRLVAPDNEQGEVGALIALLRQFGWKQVTVLATDTVFAKDLVNEFRKSWVGTHGFSVGHTDTILLVDVDNSKIVDKESVTQTLRDIPTDDPTVNSRIIFLAAHSEHAFEILRAAHEMNFQPDTVWVGPSSWVGQSDSGNDWASWLPEIPGFIGVVPFRNDDRFYTEFFSEFQAWQRKEGRKVLQELPTFAAETVDAIVVMAKALAETPADQRRDGATIVKRLRSISFDGVSGRVEFTSTGDRKNPKYAIYNVPTSRLSSETKDIVWTMVGEVEFKLNNTFASVNDNVCFAAPAGCGIANTPDDTYPDKVKLPRWVAAVMAILCLLFLAVAFKYWRSRKSKNSIRAELEAFQNSIVDMKAAACNYIPHVDTKSTTVDPKEQSLTVLPVIRPPVVRWCWKETASVMDRHDASTIYGNPADCWILYSDDQNKKLEAAYLKKAIECIPLSGYKVDLKAMVQTNIATKYQRPVCRHVERDQGGPDLQQQQPITFDLSNVKIGDALPSDLQNEPQMVLVQGDVIQITKKRDDGWAFGTKLHHADEEVARQLVQAATVMTATTGATGGGDAAPVENVNNPNDEANIFPDTGWFPMTSTRSPSPEELKTLKQKVANGTLDPPKHWAPTKDPTVAERHVLFEGDMERSGLLQSFLSTLGGRNIQIVRVERIQNMAMFQSYVVKRQTICYRETAKDDHKNNNNGDSTMVQEKALARFERRWLWHGTNAEVVDKIMNQGFNRSFCGKNATAYGKGVYFARDASYSSSPTYSVPDLSGNQYILACSVCVGEYCKGKHDALTPDVRDVASHSLFDTTVDSLINPSIYVTYHDAQAYPEYLITFRQK